MKINESKTSDLNGFVISRCNKRAAERCFSLASGRQEQGTILSVCGPSPCGKTSLLYATAGVYNKKYGSGPIKVSFQQMIDDFIAAVHEKSISDLYDKYSAEKLLLIDDTKDIRGFVATQEAFADIFTKLIERGVSIILFSDCKLNRYNELYTELRKNCVPMSEVYMRKADFTLRRKVLENLLAKENIHISKRIFWCLVINKKIDVAFFRGCLSKIDLIRILEDGKADDKRIMKVLREYKN